MSKFENLERKVVFMRRLGSLDLRKKVRKKRTKCRKWRLRHEKTGFFVFFGSGYLD